MEKMLKEIGQRICMRRKELKYTQEQLAEMMDVSVQMISNLERGNKAIRIDNLVKLCTILNVSADYILIGKRSEVEQDDIYKKMNMLSDDDFRMIMMLVDYCSNRPEV